LYAERAGGFQPKRRAEVAAVTEASTKDKILHTIRTLDKLPTLPVVVDLLTREIGNPDANATSIAKIINDDPAIMARVLKLVNSPLYAPTFKSKTAITIQAAVVRMGVNALRDIVLSTSVMTLFPARGAAAFNRDEFWKHSICVGLVAKVVREFSGRELTFADSELGLAGLCHDIGKVVLDQYFNEQFMDVIEHAKTNSKLLYESEQALLGLDHGEVGQALAERWKLPEHITAVIRYHHAPEKLAGKPHETLVRLVGLADYICNHQHLGFSGNCRNMDFPKASFDMLELPMAKIPDIILRVKEEAQKSDIFLTISGTKGHGH
jgi:putative nucleotidyltransferase with HDIG domain